ncbi:unnamed protein product [Paramecium primaurelia]|uniref:F-box domain-containing protein n=1 Tax=Paramecium primaurelia TaxID=5886 RepID=A0A8S1PHP3_PARPR|nr:unnamed protein product [Paramecium primaurelia]
MFKILPRHIILNILQYLSIQDILRMRRVNRQLWMIIQAHYQMSLLQCSSQIDLSKYKVIGVMLQIVAKDSGMSKHKPMQNYLMKLHSGRIELSYYDSAYQKIGQDQIVYVVQKGKEKEIIRNLEIIGVSPQSISVYPNSSSCKILSILCMILYM